MARRRPQGLDLAALVSRFQSEEKCRAYLEELRWPEGVRCLRCHANKGISRIESRDRLECRSCGYQFSVRVGTILHASHLPLWKWFLATYVLGQAKQGVAANQLKEVLGISYKTAWYLSHRIRAAMKDDVTELVRGIVESFETETAGSDIPVESARSAFKRSIVGSYHHVSEKYLPAYLDEMAFRYRNQENSYLFRDTLLRLIEAKSVPYAELTAAT